MGNKYNKKGNNKAIAVKNQILRKSKIKSKKTSASASENEQLTEKERQQQETIDELLKRVEALEDKVQYLESSLYIAKTTSDNLEIMVDNQQQYSRRPCMVVSGKAKAESIKISSNKM